MFWRTRVKSINLSKLEVSLSGFCDLLQVQKSGEKMWEIIRFGEEQCNEEQRRVLAVRLGELLEVDFGDICERRILNLIAPNDLVRLNAQGVDVQLHTHRHQLPHNETGCSREITVNRAVLEPILGTPLKHFCYPSGEWGPECWPWLEALGILSAVTCDPGLNYPETPKLALKRFLDSDVISQIEFESEMSGFSELLRYSRCLLTGWLENRCCVIPRFLNCFCRRK
jgi:hypothetical protein